MAKRWVRSDRVPLYLFTLCSLFKDRTKSKARINRWTQTPMRQQGSPSRSRWMVPFQIFSQLKNQNGLLLEVVSIKTASQHWDVFFDAISKLSSFDVPHVWLGDPESHRPSLMWDIRFGIQKKVLSFVHSLTRDSVLSTKNLHLSGLFFFVWDCESPQIIRSWCYWDRSSSSRGQNEKCLFKRQRVVPHSENERFRTSCFLRRLSWLVSHAVIDSTPF